MNAQNLVPNGDFESYFWCPTQVDQGSNAVAWGSGNSYIFPEYFNSCASLSSLVSTPQNSDSLLGYQVAHSGNGYAGINVYQDTNPYPVDYLQTQLTDSLDSGKYYCLTFYVSLVNISTWGVDAIGAYFDKQPSSICSTFTCVLTYIPQVSNPAGTILLDTLNWMKIEGCFQAQGGEKYMIIGNFKDNAHTQKALNNSGGYNWSTYYYIDDVSLYEDTILSIPETHTDNSFSTYPNPTNKEVQVRSTKEIDELLLMDLSGNVVVKKQHSKTIDVSDLADGLYLLLCTFKGGEIGFQKLVVLHDR